jgi:hypothetical protein
MEEFPLFDEWGRGLSTILKARPALVSARIPVKIVGAAVPDRADLRWVIGTPELRG